MDYNNICDVRVCGRRAVFVYFGVETKIQEKLKFNFSYGRILNSHEF
jgi:hypothetical protein